MTRVGVVGGRFPKMVSWLLFVAFISLCGLVVVRMTEGTSLVPSWAHRGLRGPARRAYQPVFAAAPRSSGRIQGWVIRTPAVVKLVLFLALVMALVGGMILGLGSMLARAFQTGG